MCDTLPDGSLSLGLRRRQKTLARLLEEGRLEAALDANQGVESKYLDVLRRAVDQPWIKAHELAARGELQAAYEIAEWLALSDFRPFDRDQVTVLLERRRRIAPLRRLLGKHFRGRRKERQLIDRHLRGAGAPILSLWGVGGVGKSALLGKVLLELERPHGTAPWVYLDFDDPEVDPMHPRGLVELIARQLGEFFAGAAIAHGFQALESVAAGDDLAFTLRLEGEATDAQLLEQVHLALLEQPAKPSLCVVLDTFEQVQVRGRRAVELVRGLLDEIVRTMPYARVIVSGRAQIAPWEDDDELRLADLDAESADEVLVALGVADATIRARVLERVGRSPLSLRLAADAITSESLEEEDIETLVLKARRLELKEGRALRHRQDVREVMLRLMIEDPAWAERLNEIHARAIDHYSGRTDAIGRAEELYHRLMRDDQPETFDALWREDLAPSLGRCWDEPLPARARAWLGPRIGRTHGDREAWRDEDWEVAAEREATARLATGDAEGALEVLAQRRQRTAGSRLHRLTIEALARQERWQEAAEQVAPALDSAAAAGRLDEALELHLLGAEIGLAGERWSFLEQHLERALKISIELNDSSGQLRALLLRVRADALRGNEAARALSATALETVLVSSDERQLRHDQALTRRVLSALAPHSAPVLRKMAATFGNRSDQEVIQRDAFKLEDLLKQVGTTTAGKQQLSELASQVGLSKKNYRFQDLAGQAVRHGKLGDALVTVLDHAGFDEKVRAGAASMFRDL